MPTCTGIKRNILRKPQVGDLVVRPILDFALVRDAWWGTVVFFGDASSAWIDVIRVVQVVPIDVMEVRMSWECHVFCEGSGLVQWSWCMLYDVGDALSSVPIRTELLTFSNDCPDESMVTLVLPSSYSKIPSGRFSYLGRSQGLIALNLKPLGLQI